MFTYILHACMILLQKKRKNIHQYCFVRESHLCTLRGNQRLGYSISYLSLDMEIELDDGYGDGAHRIDNLVTEQQEGTIRKAAVP